MKPLTPESGPAYLFCPASRPDRYQKALDRADFVIIDLEDAVAPAEKTAAREALANNPIDPQNVIVRINPLGTPQSLEDLDVLVSLKYRRIMVAKAEDPAAMAALTGFEVIALCETARGVLAAPEIASVPTVIALMWGAEDLILSLGGRSSRSEDGDYLDVARLARAQVLLASGASRKPAIDAVVLDIGDEETLHDESLVAAASGFVGKACIHPKQVQPVRDGYRATASQLAWADQVLSATAGGGVHVVNGMMVDEPHRRLAARLRSSSRAAP